MSDQARKFRTRLREVEAMQWTGDNAEALAAWTAGAFRPVAPEDRTDDPEASGQLLSGPHRAWWGVRPGDWIVRLAGMYFSPSADDFERMYVPVVVTDPRLAQLRECAADAIAETHQPGYFGGQGPNVWSPCIDGALGGPAGKYCAAAHPELVIELLDEREHVRAELGRAASAQLAMSARNDELRTQVSARDARITELEQQAEAQAEEIAANCKALARLRELARDRRDDVLIANVELEKAEARITELEEHAARPVPWRCQATTTDPNLIVGTADQRAAWCELPNGHAGMHQAALYGGAALYWPEVGGR